VWDEVIEDWDHAIGEPEDEDWVLVVAEDDVVDVVHDTGDVIRDGGEKEEGGACGGLFAPGGGVLERIETV